ncbi:DegV family EDD domain-containing protein [Acetatifactor muris]|uniref:Circadian input-output histidine kinase CikA n=1 Tax=Acetatifactor muris TaxID=879566 RepID=A0A2K4ZKV9_9FIRM|nr:DegV family protein [Acetatifactor muris]MCR2049437.1 DegV family EDD domain-containing protein [Acetatifactor muris]SOY31134.1 Sensory/regulatory protein RpfC [Acetatifactor muris]
MIKKWLEIIFDHKVSLRERMFRLVTGISMVALIFILILGRYTGNLFLLAGSLIYMYIVAKISIQKEAINAGATATVILLLVLFPVVFFTGGGIYGGVPEWFVLCFIYISVTLEGRRKPLFFLLCIAETLICYYIAYHYPELLIPTTTAQAYFDSVRSVILAGVLTSVLLLFQNHLYEVENKLTIQQKKEIEELNQAENHFFSSMSHEIRTPINTIIGLNEMILRGDISDDIAENARNIQGASKMLLTLINDILDLSKIKSGKMEIVNTSYETGELFSEIVNMIWIKAREKGLEFRLQVDPSMPSMLCGDEVRIKQVLVNLLNNAVKYTKEGSVTLSVRCERVGVNRVRVWYSVEDTGLGVKKENIPYIFDAFKRVDEKKNRHIEGTGLGLSIVKQLVELMNGEISVNSVYMNGSTFLVTLEQDIMNEKELGTFTLTSRTKVHEGAQYQRTFEAPDAHLLVVDDNEMNLLVVSKLLSDTKIHIDTASSAAECLKLTQYQHYDCILMDHLMPEMDGIECLHALHAQPGGLCQDVPVIALTANAGSDNQQLYRKEGFSGYLAKPISGALLEAAVLSILPKELVHLSEVASQSEIGKDVLIFEQAKRISLMVTTDSVCDLPESLRKEFGIKICPYYICTEQGRFLDNSELMAEELLSHIAEGNEGNSHPPEVEDYEKFFARRLNEAQNVIHITMAKHVSEGYHNAVEAAKSFENVTVIDSGHLSSSMGLSVLYAAYMAEHHASKDEIIKTVKKLRRYISSAFIIDSTHMMCRAGQISRKIQIMCDALLLHPVIVLRKSRMAVGSMEMGSFNHVIKGYIKKVLLHPGAIDRRILFITYAGMDDKSLQYIQELVRQYCPFERVYLQKASSAIACNCGPGSFGLLFMRKNDALITYSDAGK